MRFLDRTQHIWNRDAWNTERYDFSNDTNQNHTFKRTHTNTLNARQRSTQFWRERKYASIFYYGAGWIWWHIYFTPKITQFYHQSLIEFDVENEWTQYNKVFIRYSINNWTVRNSTHRHANGMYKVIQKSSPILYQASERHQRTLDRWTKSVAANELVEPFAADPSIPFEKSFLFLAALHARIFESPCIYFC